MALRNLQRKFWRRRQRESCETARENSETVEEAVTERSDRLEVPYETSELSVQGDGRDVKVSI